MSAARPPDFGKLDGAAPVWNTLRPARIALLGDFGANACAGRLETGAALARRKPHRVDSDTLDRTLARMCPAITVPLGDDAAPIRIALPRLHAFDPLTLVRDLDIFQSLAALRRRLANNLGFVQAAEEIRAWEIDAPAAASLATRPGGGRGGDLRVDLALEDFARLAGRPSATDRPAASGALLRQTAGPFVMPSGKQDQAGLVAGLDRAMAETLGALMHHPDLRLAEALWRGVDYLLQRLPADGSVQVDLIDISAEEFAADLSAQSDLSRTGLYRLLVDQPAGETDAGYRYLGACYRFTATPAQIALLGRAARVCAHAGAPFITAIEPQAFIGPDAAMAAPLQDAFDALRGLPEANFLALVAPHFLLRSPHGTPGGPAGLFRYEEFTGPDDLGHLLWGHPALPALCRLVGSGQARAPARRSPAGATGTRSPAPLLENMLQDGAVARLGGQGINSILPDADGTAIRLTMLATLDGAALPVDGPA